MKSHLAQLHCVTCPQLSVLRWIVCVVSLLLASTVIVYYRGKLSQHTPRVDASETVEGWGNAASSWASSNSFEEAATRPTGMQVARVQLTTAADLRRWSPERRTTARGGSGGRGSTRSHDGSGTVLQAGNQPEIMSAHVKDATNTSNFATESDDERQKRLDVEDAHNRLLCVGVSRVAMFFAAVRIIVLSTFS